MENTIKAKPIFLIGLDFEKAEQSVIEDIQKTTQDLLIDYHVLVYTSPNINRIEFQCFNPSDFDPIEMDEIRKIIEEKWKQ
jgi:hypothetical protein